MCIRDRLYIGREDHLLSPGIYRYTIEYRVPLQVALYEDFDELYWNAVGSDVIFPVEKASCIVRLPEGQTLLGSSCYTGLLGATGDECSVSEMADGSGTQFDVIGSLSAFEGFTLKLKLAKGYMDLPTLWERFGSLWILALGSLLILIYSYVTWSRHGVDPPKPKAEISFLPPHNYSPAQLSYLKREMYTNKSFVASLINLAVKGYIRMDEEETGTFVNKKHFHIQKLKDDYVDLPEEEMVLMRNLFTQDDLFTIDGKYNERMKTTLDKHKKTVLGIHSRFIKAGYNQKFLTWPILGTLFTWVGAFVVFKINGGDLNAEGVTEAFGPLALGLILFVPLSIVGLILYAYLIKKPSPEKQALKARIEGFEEYLAISDLTENLSPDLPEHTSDQYEKMLPYAIALGKEKGWSNAFKPLLKQQGYEPGWSNNSMIYAHPGYYNSFSRSMSSTATQPSSSSSGGGFSGGGGGGGGVGGW